MGHTVLALKFVYYFDGKKAYLMSMSNDTSILLTRKLEVISSISLAAKNLTVSKTHGTSK
jgi:hypothetical protein